MKIIIGNEIHSAGYNNSVVRHFATNQPNIIFRTLWQSDGVKSEGFWAREEIDPEGRPILNNAYEWSGIPETWPLATEGKEVTLKEIPRIRETGFASDLPYWGIEIEGKVFDPQNKYISTI